MDDKPTALLRAAAVFAGVRSLMLIASMVLCLFGLVDCQGLDTLAATANWDAWAVIFSALVVSAVLCRPGARLEAVSWGSVVAVIGAAYSSALLGRVTEVPPPLIGPLLPAVLWLVAWRTPEPATGVCGAVVRVGMGLSALIAAPAVFGLQGPDWVSLSLLGLMGIGVIACRTGLSAVLYPRSVIAAIAVVPIGIHLALHAIPGYGESTAIAADGLNWWLAGGVLGIGLGGLLDRPEMADERIDDNDERRDSGGPGISLRSSAA